MRKTEKNKITEILYDLMQFNLTYYEIKIYLSTYQRVLQKNKQFEKLERIKWTQTYKLQKSTKYIQLETQ